MKSVQVCDQALPNLCSASTAGILSAQRKWRAVEGPFFRLFETVRTLISLSTDPRGWGRCLRTVGPIALTSFIIFWQTCFQFCESYQVTLMHYWLLLTVFFKSRLKGLTADREICRYNAKGWVQHVVCTQTTDACTLFMTGDRIQNRVPSAIQHPSHNQQ